jgi:hypothetical protein
MENIREIVQSFFVVDSIWSIVFRAGIWFGIATVIIISTDVANPDRSTKTLKTNLGFFLLFLVLSGGLMYLLFGFIAQPADPSMAAAAPL